MKWDLMWRYVFELATLYPGAVLCYLPVKNHLRLTLPRLVLLGLIGITAVVFGGALAGTLLTIGSNAMSIPIFMLTFLAYRRTLKPELTTGKAAYAFATTTSVIGACSMMASLLTAASELKNSAAVWLATTSLLTLALSLAGVLLYVLLIRRRLLWLMDEFHAPRVWRIAWLLPTFFTVIYMLMLPWDPATILVNRVQHMGVILVAASVVVFLFLTFLFYRIARELTVNARLAAENQMLTIEAHRYQELRRYMEETRLMRHDFRQHLHVIAQLTDTGQTGELKQYLRQCEQELGGEHTTLCANAAVDAIAGYYNSYAVSHGVHIDWKIALPEALPLPETDICMLLGNLLENALYASSLLPAPQRSMRVICQMLSPEMLGLIVENAYNGVLKQEGDVFLSTRHDGAGFGLQSVENTVRRYHGKLTIETENRIFSVNVLLNL